jgi:hypothetical protein
MPFEGLKKGCNTRNICDCEQSSTAGRVFVHGEVAFKIGSQLPRARATLFEPVRQLLIVKLNIQKHNGQRTVPNGQFPRIMTLNSG